MTQIFGLGNAIVDVEVHVKDSFLADQGLPKGVPWDLQSGSQQSPTERSSLA